jgi:hypothetical protein
MIMCVIVSVAVLVCMIVGVAAACIMDVIVAVIVAAVGSVNMTLRRVFLG